LNPINCSDCRSFWIFKSEKLKTQILNAHCDRSSYPYGSLYSHRSHSYYYGMSYSRPTIWEKEAQLREQCEHNSTTQTLTPTFIIQYLQTTSMPLNQQNKIHPNKLLVESQHQDDIKFDDIQAMKSKVHFLMIAVVSLLIIFLMI